MLQDYFLGHETRIDESPVHTGELATIVTEFGDSCLIW